MGIIFGRLNIRVLGYFFLCGLTVLLASGCRNSDHLRKYYYFDHQLESKNLPVFIVGQEKGASMAPKDPFVKIGDRLAIRTMGNFSISDNLGTSGSGEGGMSYPVDGDGTIALPMLGRVRVVGLTRKEVGKRLETLYSNFVVDPLIEVFILSHSVFLWGEVRLAGVYELKSDRTSLIEVLTRAGGITPLGKRAAVRVIRTNASGKKEVLIFDLTKFETLNQEELWLQDKDMILVEPKGVKIFTDNISPYIGLISLGTSVISITLVFVTLLTRRNTP